MTLPVQTQAVADERGLLTPTWRRWLADLERRVTASSNDGLASDIAAIATALGSPDGTVANIPPQADNNALIVGLDGILTEGTIANGRVTVKLVDLEDTGEGAGLYKITRDDKGRVEGTASATTDDLTEGTDNLYFTDERAQDAVGAAIAAGTGDGVTLAYDDANGKINATNTDKGTVAVTAHEAATDPHPQYLQAGEAEPPITAGTTAQYRRGDKTWQDFATDVRGAALTGLSTATATAITATDSVLVGFGKAQAQINANVATLAGKASTGANTFTGTQTIQSSGSPTLSIVSTSAGSAICNLDSQAGTLATLNFKTNGSNRWVFTKGSTAESGSNVGSDFELRAHTDAGAFNFRAFTVKRESGDILFGRDNLQNLGGASNRLKEIFCGNATINTSDAREKTPLRPLTDMELAVARDLAGMIGMFRWLASTEEKGDGARLHAGVIAQEVAQAFAARGLDANGYGFFCYDEWPETVEPAEYEAPLGEDGEPTGEMVCVKPEVIHPAGNRYGIRYGELAMFLLAGQEQRLRALEAKA